MMGSTSLSHDFRSLSRQPPADPDIQATLSDFLTYTEHFPSHLTRALALIEGQRTHAEKKIRSIHEDTTAWTLLPTVKDGRRDPTKLRRNISYALEEAERASRMAVEEAIRLDELCTREAKRLDTVVEKLKAHPIPPSRDPTPPQQQQQQPLTSPNLKRERRLSTRVDEAKVEKASRKLDDKAATKLRGRRIMVPGEVLPPPDPNVPPESVSDWTSPRQSPPLEEASYSEKEKKTATPRPRSRTPKSSSRAERERDRKTPKPRIPRAPGQPGTNAHSAVAGISTSNALLALTQPPEDAPKGSKWLPWMALTEWEMAKLRKRMKKNAIWVPSQTMVRRELKNLGRGLAGKDAARKEAESTGGEFVDEANMPDPTKTVLEGEEPAKTVVLLDDRLYDGGDAGDQDQELINRGMRLNEAKKLKRQRMLEEQALQAQIAREQGTETGSGEGQTALSPTDTKKRKREGTPLPDQAATGDTAEAVDTPPKPTTKKIKINASATAVPGTSKVPLAPAGVSSSPRPNSTRYRRAATPPARKPTLVLKAAKAVSEEPPSRRSALRRNSNVSLPNGPTLTSPGRATRPSASNAGGGRRNRRPAPGILTTADADSAKVGVSKRKAAPRKKAAAGRLSSDATAIPEVIIEEDIDPDEPRYCLCGDVSWGTMIACDNDDCEKEWFHLSCVGLQELPPRRTQWYCPDCRKKLKLGVTSNGVVGRTNTGGR